MKASVKRTMERRLRQVRGRLALRRWEYRQRDLAHGVWFRLRRVLADASTAHAIAAEEANRLLAEGYAAEPVGAELEPAKVIIFVPAERLASIAGARELSLRLGGELLAARYIALVPFPESGRG